jgi:predicted O-methyltransferase YrrM
LKNLILQRLEGQNFSTFIDPKETHMTPEEINKVLEIPDWDTASAVKVTEAKFIYDFIKEKGIERTLEVGFAFARSASHIMAASGKQHYACDPFQDTYAGMGLKNLEKLGMREQLTFFPDFSHNVMPAMHKEGKEFQFIFLDGDHKFDGILVDFYYADLLLEQGGYVLMHDTWMRSTRLVERFVQTNRKDFKKIDTPLRNFSLFQKVGKDERNGMFFKEFWTLQSLFTHNVIIWLTQGKQTWLKKMVFKLKDLLK